MNTLSLPRLCVAATLGGTVGVLPLVSVEAAALTPALTIVVNSAQDGPIRPDQQLTLREAIAIANGTLPTTDLSAAEQAQVTAGSGQIRFALPAGEGVIELRSQLPPITAAGLVIDGTSQPGYPTAPTGQIATPKIALTPAPNTEVFRGLTLAADNITVRGLSLYGFTAAHQYTASTPPADIFIVHQALPKRHKQALATKAEVFLFDQPDQTPPPQGIVIEDNWLGITPTDQMPSQPSAFGVSVFNSKGTTIRRNRIAHHDGSAIITGHRAENLTVSDNQIIGNGLAGMPDAIRLEGKIANAMIRNNLICGNDGSAVYLFKPDGAVTIHNNDIKFNGQRLRRSAVYVMGNDHQIRNNQIRHQSGPGVTVAAYPQSDRNQITHNRFAALEGLSIDLVTRRHTHVSDYQRGDGANVAQRDTNNRRRDTANRAINTPIFLSRDFYLFGNQVGIDGLADPGATITLYKVMEGDNPHGPLSEPLQEVIADTEGRFSAEFNTLQPGDRISAIATHPNYGTSEPALNAEIRALEQIASQQTTARSPKPDCGPEPIAAKVDPPQIVPVAVQVQIPRTVHFALDQDTLSKASQVALDQIIAVLQAHPTIVVDLHGHTDSRASAAYNQALAQRRAMQVRRYLLAQGIDPARITIRSWGETELLNEERDRTDYARNRRVEFVYRDVRGVKLVIVDQEQDLQVEP